MGVAWGAGGGAGRDPSAVSLDKLLYLPGLAEALAQKSPSNAPPQPCSDLPAPAQLELGLEVASTF